MTDSSRMQFKSVTYAGQAPGPRFIVTGAVHGNETCGTQGITRVLAELDAGQLAILRGSVTFVPIVNPLAYAKRDRAGDRNLNRNLFPVDAPQDFEDRIANWLCPLLARHEVLLDLHSTRAATQAFAMLGPVDNDGPIEPFTHSAKERALARHLGVSRFVQGWLSTYANGVERRVAVARARGKPVGTGNTDARYGVGTTEYMRSVGGCAITLECGQHDDPASVDVAYRAIRNALAFLGLTDEAPPAPVTQYEALRLHEVIDRDHADDAFVRAWSSFDALAAGEHVATRHDGTKLTAPHAGRIVFPDAKALPGNEWFYLAQTIPAI